VSCKVVFIDGRVGTFLDQSRLVLEKYAWLQPVFILVESQPGALTTQELLLRAEPIEEESFLWEERLCIKTSYTTYNQWQNQLRAGKNLLQRSMDLFFAQDVQLERLESQVNLFGRAQEGLKGQQHNLKEGSLRCNQIWVEIEAILQNLGAIFVELFQDTSYAEGLSEEERQLKLQGLGLINPTTQQLQYACKRLIEKLEQNVGLFKFYLAQLEKSPQVFQEDRQKELSRLQNRNDYCDQITTFIEGLKSEERTHLREEKLINKFTQGTFPEHFDGPVSEGLQENLKQIIRDNLGDLEYRKKVQEALKETAILERKERSILVQTAAAVARVVFLFFYYLLYPLIWLGGLLMAPAPVQQEDDLPSRAMYLVDRLAQAPIVSSASCDCGA
jgi:hypothetical protein